MQHHTQVTILQELMRQLDAGQNIDAGVQYRMPTKDYVCTDRAQQEQQHFFRDHRPSQLCVPSDATSSSRGTVNDDEGGHTTCHSLQ